MRLCAKSLALWKRSSPDRFQKQAANNVTYIIAALVLGFVAYGLSIFFYVYAQRTLGAAKTSVYYAFAPFIGVTLSLAIFRKIPAPSFVVALFIMIAGTYFTVTEQKKKQC